MRPLPLGAGGGRGRAWPCGAGGVWVGVAARNSGGDGRDGRHRGAAGAVFEEIAAAGDEAALEAVRVAALGKKGEVSALMRGLGAMAPEDRQAAGPALNALKDDLAAALAEARGRLAAAALEARVAGEWADVTLGGGRRRRGACIR